MNFLDRIKNVKIKESTPQEADVENLHSDATQDALPQESSSVTPMEMDSSCSQEQNLVATTNDASPDAEQSSPAANSNVSEPVVPPDAPEGLPPQNDLNKLNIQTLADSLNDIQSDIMKLLSISGRQTELLASAHGKDEIIQNMHQELMEHKNNFKQEITMPMVKSMIRLYDRMTSLVTVYEAKFSAEENVPQVCKDFISEVSTSTDVILSSLAEFDIEKITVETGSQFDPKRQRCIRTEPAPEPNQNDTISSVLKVGFENTFTGRIINYPEVIVFGSYQNEQI